MSLSWFEKPWLTIKLITSFGVGISKVVSIFSIVSVDDASNSACAFVRKRTFRLLSMSCTISYIVFALISESCAACASGEMSSYAV